MIPAMEEVSIGSGVGSDGGYELSNAPLHRSRSVSPSNPTGSLTSAIAPAVPSSSWAGNFAPANAAAPGLCRIPIKSAI